jgi:predicted transcriptional regulator
MRDIISEKDMVCELKQAVDSAGSAYHFAKKYGMHDSEVYAVLSGKRHVQPKIAKILGYSKIRMWEKS